MSTTLMQIGAAIGVAAFGTLYFGANERTRADHASHAFAVTTSALTVIALLAGVAAHRAAASPGGAG